MEEAEREQCEDEHESFGEREERDPARRPRRRAGECRRYDDPVRDPPLEEVAFDHRAECRAEQREPYERKRRLAKKASAKREAGGTSRGRDASSCCHGSRGAAVARALTVSVDTPTRRSKIVGIRPALRRA